MTLLIGAHFHATLNKFFINACSKKQVCIQVYKMFYTDVYNLTEPRVRLYVGISTPFYLNFIKFNMDCTQHQFVATQHRCCFRLRLSSGAKRAASRLAARVHIDSSRNTSG